MKATIEGPYGKFTKMDAVKQVAIMKDLKGIEDDVRVKTDELAAKDGEIQQLQQRLEQAQVPAVPLLTQSDGLRHINFSIIILKTFSMTSLSTIKLVTASYSQTSVVYSHMPVHQWLHIYGHNTIIRINFIHKNFVLESFV